MPSDRLTATVRPQLLQWARTRAGLTVGELGKRMGLRAERVAAWEASGAIRLTHLQRLAEKTHTPIGYLFLQEPPQVDLPVADFRRADAPARTQVSLELLDTIHACQRRQAWYRDFVRGDGAKPLTFVGSATTADEPVAVAADIRRALRLDDEPIRGAYSADDVLKALVERAGDAGILVMRSGVVGNNTHRKLDVAEFRGFALSDEYAPLIFVNASDAKAAQMFTLAHECGHLWLGESAVSDADPETSVPTERFCNAVAAEVLVPLEQIRALWEANAPVDAQAARLARDFRVSALVVLIRAFEAGLISRAVFQNAYAAERRRLQEVDAGGGGGGGDFYATQNSRVGSSFARAVVASALEGRTTYTEAFRLLGVRGNAFDKYAKRLGFAL